MRDIRKRGGRRESRGDGEEGETGKRESNRQREYQQLHPISRRFM